jgi:hypothetical protein
MKVDSPQLQPGRIHARGANGVVRECFPAAFGGWLRSEQRSSIVVDLAGSDQAPRRCLRQDLARDICCHEAVDCTLAGLDENLPDRLLPRGDRHVLDSPWAAPAECLHGADEGGDIEGASAADQPVVEGVGQTVALAGRSSRVSPKPM